MWMNTFRSEQYAGAGVLSKPATKPLHTLVIAWILLFPLLFFVARGTFSFDRQRTESLADAQANPVTDTRSGSVYYQLEQLLAYAVVVAVIVPTLPGMIEAIRENLLVFSLPVFALVSTLWSQSAAKTIPFAVFVLTLTAFGLYLSRKFAPDRQVELFLFVGWATIILSFIAVALIPNAGIEHEDAAGAWRGMFVQKNHCGEIMTLMLYPAFFAKPKTSLQRLGLVMYVLLGTVIVGMSQSRTAWIIYTLSLGFIGLLKLLQRLGPRERLLLIVALAVAGCVAATAAISYAPQIAMLLGKDPTLTGRTKIWAAVANAVAKRPVLGYGYKAFWQGLQGESLNVGLAVGATALTNSENAVLEIWLELGLVGVLIMLLILFQACRNAITCLWHDNTKYVRWYSLIVFFNVLALVDGGKVMFPHTIEWLLLVVAYAGLAAEARRIRMQRIA